MYTGVDVHTFNSKCIDGSTDTTYYINCPKCSERVIVKRW